MRLAAVAMVKNEADIIEPFVRHNLTHVDMLIVADDSSCDATPVILESLQREGLPLEVRKRSYIGRHQASCVTELMREAVDRFAADWVFLLDADEFIIGEKPHEVLSHSNDSPTGIQWRTYCPTRADNDQVQNTVERILHCRMIEPNASWKIIAPAEQVKNPEVTAYQGNHFLLHNGEPMTWRQENRLQLAHFPIRSGGQYVNKTLMSAFQYAALGLNRDVTWGTRCHRELDRFLADPREFFASWREQALTFALSPEAPTPHLRCEPIAYQGGALRYAKCGVTEDDCWQILVNYSLLLATAYGALRDQQGRVDHTEADVICEWSRRLAQREEAYQTALEQIRELKSDRAQLQASIHQRPGWLRLWRRRRAA